MEEYELLINKAIIGTSVNNPNWDMGKQMDVALSRYIDQFTKKETYPIRKICAHFSSKLNAEGILLRDPVFIYAVDHKYDVALGFLDLLYRYGVKKIKDSNLSLKQTEQLNGYINSYLYVLSRVTFNKDRYRSTLGNISPLASVKEIIYKNPDVLRKLVSKSVVDARINETYLSNIVNMYLKDIEKTDVFGFNSIEDVSVSETAKEVLTNVVGTKVVNSFSGQLLDGMITIASDRGYINKSSRPQQDSVLAMAKSEDCFLSLVADGAGGALKGEIASMSIVKKLATWFNNLSIDDLKSLDMNELANVIDQQLVEVNNEIYKKYDGGSYSTFALALCVGGDTLIANVGDSMIYSYDEKVDKLVEVTVLDSCSNGLPYEEARRNIMNNRVTNAVGLSYVRDDRKNLFAHYGCFHNSGEKLIISSDGVTDLIAEKRFKDYFKQDVDASKIVSDAVYTPDRFKVFNQWGELVDGKSQDNVSAIVINLPNNYKDDTKSDRRM